jgi:ATP-dependent helicase/nuclease subunit B
LELSGAITIATKFTLLGRADRIERRDDGSIFILDYKTGNPPNTKTLLSGTAPQLPLEAMMAQAGAFGDCFMGPVTEIAVWKLSGGRIDGDDPGLMRDPDQLRSLISIAAANLPLLFLKFSDPRVPYLARPHPNRALNREIYDGISRRAEWLNEDEVHEDSV